jgi:hypothetical protein
VTREELQKLIDRRNALAATATKLDAEISAIDRQIALVDAARIDEEGL